MLKIKLCHDHGLIPDSLHEKKTRGGHQNFKTYRFTCDLNMCDLLTPLFKEHMEQSETASDEGVKAHS